MPEPKDMVATCPNCGERVAVPHCLQGGCPWVDCRPCGETINPRAIKRQMTKTGLIAAPSGTFAHMLTDKP